MVDAPLVQEKVEIRSVFPAGRVQAVALHYIATEVRVHHVTLGEALQQCLDGWPVGPNGGYVVEAVGLVYLAGMWMYQSRLPVHEAPSLLTHIQSRERIPFPPATGWKHPQNLGSQLCNVVGTNRHMASRELLTIRYQTLLLHSELQAVAVAIGSPFHVNNLVNASD